jgi:predicted CDP-diglyceride synthetase/phosphatidate cytidylyltransferase
VEEEEVQEQEEEEEEEIDKSWHRNSSFFHLLFLLELLSFFLDRRTDKYHSPNLKLVIKVWIPMAFLMRLAMKLTLERRFFNFFQICATN